MNNGDNKTFYKHLNINTMKNTFKFLTRHLLQVP